LTDVGPAVAAMRAGAEDYLPKPIDFDVLSLVLDRALDRRSARPSAGPRKRDESAAAAQRTCSGRVP
jgi:two-component system response regulator HydG